MNNMHYRTLLFSSKLCLVLYKRLTTNMLCLMLESTSYINLITIYHADIPLNKWTANKRWFTCRYLYK